MESKSLNKICINLVKRSIFGSFSFFGMVFGILCENHGYIMIQSFSFSFDNENDDNFSPSCAHLYHNKNVAC